MKRVIYTVLALAPALSLAQDLGNIDTLTSNLVNTFSNIVPVIFAIGVLYFLWGLVKFIRTAGGGDPKAHEAGRSHMIYGILALLVMISVFGIINWLGNTADLNNNAPELPDLTEASV